MMSCLFQFTGSFLGFPVMSSVSVMSGEFLILTAKTRDVLDLRFMSMFMY